MSFESPSAHRGPASVEGRQHVRAGMAKAPVAAALGRARRGAFSSWDEGDDLPALAMIVPLGLLVIWTIWEMAGSF